jgi:galactokinase
VGEAPQVVRARPEEKIQTQMPTNRDHELELKELEALRFSSQAARSITTLEVQRKTITREYGERIKKIKAVIMLLQQRESMGQLSLEGMDAIEITPELRKLIYNPVGDLS